MNLSNDTPGPFTLSFEQLKTEARQRQRDTGTPQHVGSPRSAPRRADRMWGNIAVTQAYLTLSEVLGHVDLLLNDGRVRELKRDGLSLFEAA